jgi:hypothetical protein
MRTIAHHQSRPTLVSLVDELGDVGVDLGLQRLGQHPPHILADDLVPSSPPPPLVMVGARLRLLTRPKPSLEVSLTGGPFTPARHPARSRSARMAGRDGGERGEEPRCWSLRCGVLTALAIWKFGRWRCAADCSRAADTVATHTSGPPRCRKKGPSWLSWTSAGLSWPVPPRAPRSRSRLLPRLEARRREEMPRPSSNPRIRSPGPSRTLRTWSTWPPVSSTSGRRRSR